MPIAQATDRRASELRFGVFQLLRIINIFFYVEIEMMPNAVLNVAYLRYRMTLVEIGENRNGANLSE